MKNIELLREFIKEIFLESNKPPKDLKKGMKLYCYISKCGSNTLKDEVGPSKKKVKVIVTTPDGPSDRSIVKYSGKSFSVKTSSLKHKKK